MQQIKARIAVNKPRNYLDWFDATYEQKLFRLKIEQLFESKYTAKEIIDFTGYSMTTVKNREKYYILPLGLIKLSNRNFREEVGVTM